MNIPFQANAPHKVISCQFILRKCFNFGLNEFYDLKHLLDVEGYFGDRYGVETDFDRARL